MRTNALVVIGFIVVLSGKAAALAAQSVGVLSTSSQANVAGGVASFGPVFSGDGRHVVFLSFAGNLVTNTVRSPYLNVFRHELVTSNTVLLSVDGPGTGSGDADSAYPAISSNGQFVAFASRADNLVSGDTNATSDVFVRDSDGNATSLVSVGPGGASAKGNAAFVGFGSVILPKANLRLSGNPSISAGGRFVVFESSATNLVALADTNTAGDIFIHDRQTATTQLLSVDDSGASAGNAPSELPSTTPDARRVAFVSYATNLVAGVTNERGDIYVRDLDADTTVWASTNIALYFTNGVYRCHAPVLSGNGEFVAFKATASNEASGLLFRIDLAAGVTMLLNSNSPIAAAPWLSDDGRFLAHDDGTNVFVWDQHAGSNRLVSVRFDGSGPGNGPSVSPVLSANGRTVAFVSAATDLLSEQAPDTNGLFRIYARNLETGVVTLLTADGNGQPVRANHLLANVALSADGTLVAFDSRSDDIVPGDANRESDVFVADLVENKTRLVSRRAESRPSATGVRHVRIAPDCLSVDGRYLLFASLVKASSPQVSACCENLYIRDLLTGEEEQITYFDDVYLAQFVLRGDGQRVAYVIRKGPWSYSDESLFVFDRSSGSSVWASKELEITPTGFSGLSFSPDGLKVAYLIRQAPSADVYVFDSTTESNRLVTGKYYAYASPAQGGASPPRFSPDGRRVAFGSYSSLLVADHQRGLFIYDLLANTMSVIAAPSNSAPPGFADISSPVSYSSDFRYAVANHYGPVLYDLELWTSQLLSANITRRPVISANGTLVAYQEGSFSAGFDSGPYRIKVYHRETGVTRTIKEISSVVGAAETLQITPDGRFLIISSHSDKLTANDTNAIVDVFAHDLITGATFLLSVNREGTSSGNAASSIPIIGADGRTVIFQSFADDLVDGDYNYARDVFIARLGGIDSDGDGMDDDWEMAYFETLARTGSGDLDGDGTIDRQEFLAGTDPTNLGSVLRVITVASMSGGQCTVLWASVPGRTYQVQFKDDIEAIAWTDLFGTVVATGSTASMVDTSVSLAHRYYRVILP